MLRPLTAIGAVNFTVHSLDRLEGIRRPVPPEQKYTGIMHGTDLLTQYPDPRKTLNPEPTYTHSEVQLILTG